MMSDILFSVKNQIGTITLNRPNALNAFSMEMITNWIKILEEVRDTDSIKVLVLTGNGKAFCAGGDIKSMKAEEGFINKTDKFNQVDLGTTGMDRKNSLWKYIQKIPLLLQEIDKPVIAAVNGHAVGAGLDMALMCDMRFISQSAKISAGYINVGLVPGDGAAYFLPRIVGVDKALDLLWTGKTITAEEAKDIGIATYISKQENLLNEVYDYCEQLIKQPQVPLRLIKRSLYQGLNMDLRSSLDMISSHMGLVTELEEYKEKLKLI